jgi:hypothetical protein
MHGTVTRIRFNPDACSRDLSSQTLCRHVTHRNGCKHTKREEGTSTRLEFRSHRPDARLRTAADMSLTATDVNIRSGRRAHRHTQTHEPTTSARCLHLQPQHHRTGNSSRHPTLKNQVTMPFTRPASTQAHESTSLPMEKMYPDVTNKEPTRCD